MLEFVKVFLSWPPIVGIAIIVGAGYFRTELRNLIDRIWSLKILGQEPATQQAKLKGDAPDDGNLPTLGDGAIHEELESLQITPEQQAHIKAVFDGTRSVAHVKISLSELFFSDNIKDVLDWAR